MKLGIFGGTFDPIHRGHLRCAEEVRETFQLDRVCFVPCSVPPHRQHTPGASPNERFEMIRLAIAGNETFVVSDLEVRRPGKSYSIDTVREILDSMSKQDSLYLILGYDAFSLFSSWKDWRNILELCHVIVASRPGVGDCLTLENIPVAVREAFCYHPSIDGFVSEIGKAILPTRLTGLAVSASQIRNLRREERSIRYLVPDTVQSYIQSRRLYQESREC